MQRRDLLRKALMFLTAFHVLQAAAFIQDSDFVDAEFPKGCESPFSEARQYMEFYESAIAKIAVDRGPDYNGVADLFAVSELGRDLTSAVPNYAEQSPIDLHVKTQLCLFENIFQRSLKPGVRQANALSSSNTLLQEHLLKISKKLFEDSLKLVESALQQKALTAQMEKLAKSRAGRIEKARRMGRNKVDSAL